MSKKIRRTLTITLTETWRIFWGNEWKDDNKAVIDKINEQGGQGNLTDIAFATYISNYQESSMSTAESRAFIQRYAEALNGKAKPPALINQYIADSDDALKQHVADAEAAFPRYELVSEDLIVDGDKVVLRFGWRGTHQGSFMGIPATGREINVPGIIIYRLAVDQNNEIKIVEHWMQVDSAALMQQLGVSV